MSVNLDKKRFVLLYDCPIGKCEKTWLLNGLRKHGDVKMISTLTKRSYFELSRLYPRLKLGKVLRLSFVFLQCIRGLVLSNKNDVIVVWSRDQGCIFENLCSFFRRRRRIVSFNWLNTPTKHIGRIRHAFNNENFLPIVNNKSLEKDFVNLFNLKKWNGLFLPDAYDNSVDFKDVSYKKTDKYIFSGGVNNRDWSTLLSVAKETPTIKYVIVCDKGAINNSGLPNVAIMENISSDKYYSLMSDSFITICPLKENRVSGLINIMKSAQFGIPCISSSLDVTRMYYSSSQKDLLLYKRSSSAELKNKVADLFNLERDDYLRVASDFQDYIRNSFNPEKNVEKLIKKLRAKRWI